MASIELLPFQVTASNVIAERYRQLIGDANNRPYEKQGWATPYYQALSALTGAGKTPILADAVTQIRAELHDEPIVLWISKAKAVVEQTRMNFEAGGKYTHLIPDFIIVPLGEIKQAHVADTTAPLMIMATVGSFNQKSKEDGTLRVHRKDEDTRDGALWEVLRKRSVGKGTKRRRPLMIVYDEAHNLSDQQADLLLELEPDVLLVASATMKTPGRLGMLIERLRNYGWDDAKLVTGVSSPAVVEAGLVKRQIILGGYASVMEDTIDDMLDELAMVQRKAVALNAGFAPKAIYVCRTNISQLDGTRDTPTRPFNERQAPPILIWRHLVRRGIDPRSIAVYCDLKIDRRGNPPPDDFILFSGGEDDFASFAAGDYRHVIFNQGLQEGWDDPSCCFAYVDKSMGSSIQVEQVIGRVLRQPNARHYPDADLNSAHFFIRTDSKQTFPAILDEVRERIGAEIPEVRIDGYVDSKTKTKVRRDPKKVLTIPEVHTNLEDPEPLFQEVGKIIDYSRDSENTLGRGERVRAIQMIGQAGEHQVTTEEMLHSNRVLARWIVRRGVQMQYPRAVAAIDWSIPKFDARVEVTSPAAESLRRSAEQLVKTYLEHSDLVLEEENLYSVGPVMVDPRKVHKFSSSLHEGYSDLRESELPFARAIDAMGFPWVRNPENGGYAIPLLSAGGTFNFYPDFLVWKGDVVYAIDPKGSHLIAQDAWRKLLNVSNDAGKARLLVRLITDGHWTSPGECKSKAGYSLWIRDKGGVVKAKPYESIEEVVKASLA